MDSQRRLFQLLNKGTLTLTSPEKDELLRLQIQSLECQMEVLADNPEWWAVHLRTVVIPPLLADLKTRALRPAAPAFPRDSNVPDPYH